MVKLNATCWNCGRQILGRNALPTQYVKQYYQGQWPKDIPPPGSYLCHQCHLPILEKVALNGGKFYHLLRSPKDLKKVLQILIGSNQTPLGELLKDGITLDPASLYEKDLVSTIEKILDKTATEEILIQWGKEHGGWGCGINASVDFIVDAAWRILKWTPPWLATARSWDEGSRDVYIGTANETRIRTTDPLCILRITVLWGFQGIFTRGMFVVIPNQSGHILWFRGMEKFERLKF